MRDPTDGTEVRHGRTYGQWLVELHRALDQRFHRNKNVEQRMMRAMRGQPLWDYWSSGYAPVDCAQELP